MVSIKEIKLKDLDSFARALFASPDPADIIPISPQRIVAHAHNPCAQPEDIVLLVAYNRNKCIGYHGLLPGWLKHDGRLSRVYWATTFYVAEEFRGQGIGKLLIEKIKALNIDFAVTGMTLAAEKAYLNAGLKPLGPIEFYRLHFEKFYRVKFLYRMSKRFLYHQWLGRQTGDLQEFHYQPVNHISTALKNNKACRDDCAVFHRDIELINWMLSYPWVVSKNEATAENKNYHFAGVREVFEYIALQVYSKRDGDPKGFFVLSLSRKKNKTVIKILDYYVPDSNGLGSVCRMALKYAEQYLADRIEIPRELQNHFQGPFFKKYFFKKKKRSYVYHPGSSTSPLASFADRISLNYCDGDTAFT